MRLKKLLQNSYTLKASKALHMSTERPSDPSNILLIAPITSIIDKQLRRAGSQYRAVLECTARETLWEHFDLEPFDQFTKVSAAVKRKADTIMERRGTRKKKTSGVSNSFLEKGRKRKN